MLPHSCSWDGVVFTHQNLQFRSVGLLQPAPGPQATTSGSQRISELAPLIHVFPVPQSCGVGAGVFLGLQEQPLAVLPLHCSWGVHESPQQFAWLHDVHDSGGGVPPPPGVGVGVAVSTQHLYPDPKFCTQSYGPSFDSPVLQFFLHVPPMVSHVCWANAASGESDKAARKTAAPTTSRHKPFIYLL